jgi:hypothetical protein
MPRVPPERIGRAADMPAGYSSVENLVETCRALGHIETMDGEPLENFDCNRARLGRVLAERASEAGADLLVATQCGWEGRTLRCTATAARAHSHRANTALETSDYDPGPVPGPAVIERWDEPRASAAEAIEIDLELTGTYAARGVRRAADVAEPAALPVSHREVGTLTARCDSDECSPRELRQGLRIAAGAVGVSDLVAVRCFERNETRECVAGAAVSRIDE